MNSKKKELTLLVIKPEGFQRGHVGRVIDRILRKGLRIKGIKKLRFDKALVYKQYGEYMHSNVGIHNNILFSLTKGVSYTFILQGTNATIALRQNVGFYKFPAPGTIRGDYMHSLKNGSVIHSSDGPVEFLEEVKRLAPEFYFDNIFKRVDSNPKTVSLYNL